jgi:hypothetical protein
MGNFFDKLSIYDQLGYIMVGFYALGITGVFLVIFGRLDIGYILTISDSDNFILVLLVMIVVGFIFGHLIQALSNFVREFMGVVAPEDAKAKERLPEIYEEARKYFKLSDEVSAGMVFHYCYLYTLWYDNIGQVSTFMSLNVFYKGLFTATGLGLIGGLVLIMIELMRLTIGGAVLFSTVWLLLYVAILGIFALVLRHRMNQFYDLATEKTLIMFHLLLRKYLEK